MNKEILRLAFPNIVSNVTIPLVSAVDTMLMGHLSSSHLAALGIVSSVFLFLYGAVNFLRSGTTGISAQAFGANNKETLAFTLYRAILVALFLGLLLILLKTPIKAAAFYLLNIDSSLWHYASDYFDIRIYTAPAVFIIYVLTGWFFGLQNANYPLIITLVVNLANILLSYLFVVVFNLGITGAAYGTLIAQYLGLAVAIFLLLRYRGYFLKPILKQVLQKSALMRFFHLNKDIFIRTLMLTFSFTYFNSQAAKDGADFLALMVILLQFVIWYSYFIDGFANAAESLIGRYYGAKRWKKFYRALKAVFIWAFGFTLLFTLLYAFFTKELTMLYTNQARLIDLVVNYTPSLALMPLISFAAFVWDGVFVGMTATKAMRNSVTFATVLFIALYILGKQFIGVNALWISFLAFFFFRGVMQSFYFLKYKELLK